MTRRAVKLSGVLDFGFYWQDDPVAKTNGEFDCVLSRGDAYDFYECKYFARLMILPECAPEERRVRAIPDIVINDIGFACAGGFEFDSDEHRLITGNELHAAL